MSSTQKIFITGTDTEVGKTFFTVALIHQLQAHQISVSAFKPVAAGCEISEGQLKNSDAVAIQNALSNSPEYSTVNPIAFEPPIAPHIASVLADSELSVAEIRRLCPLDKESIDYILVEGAGGWSVPLNRHELFSDYAVSESMDVILVVGLKLGCINHALLTQASIKASGLRLVGWVANHLDISMANRSDNIETLSERLDCPLVAEIPFISEDNAALKASSYVKLDALVEKKRGRVAEINLEQSK